MFFISGKGQLSHSLTMKKGNIFPEGSTVISVSETINISLGMEGDTFLSLVGINVEHEKV